MEEHVEITYKRPRRFKIGTAVKIVRLSEDADESMHRDFLNKTGVVKNHSPHEKDETFLRLVPVQIDGFRHEAYFEEFELEGCEPPQE